MTAQVSATGLEERRADVEGLGGPHLTRGEGDPVVLLHGNGESASSAWRRVMPRLSSSRRVLAPSLLELDAPQTNGAHYSSDALTDVVAGFLQATRTGKATLIGNSLGGLLAVRVTLRWPERVGCLVLADSVGLGPEVNRLLAAVSLPGYGELAVRWGRTRVGAVQRALLRSPALRASGPCAGGVADRAVPAGAHAGGSSRRPSRPRDPSSRPGGNGIWCWPSWSA